MLSAYIWFYSNEFDQSTLYTQTLIQPPNSDSYFSIAILHYILYTIYTGTLSAWQRCTRCVCVESIIYIYIYHYWSLSFLYILTSYHCYILTFYHLSYSFYSAPARTVSTGGRWTTPSVRTHKPCVFLQAVIVIHIHYLTLTNISIILQSHISNWLYALQARPSR